MIQTKRTSRGFTLVELLVVIGIIGALIAILLPVLSGVQARGRDIKCKSNLRQIVQALLGYAAENKGSFPYGSYYNRSINHLHPQGNPDPWAQQNTWLEASDNAGSSGDPDNDHPFISWASQVGKYMGKRLNGDNDDANFPPVLRCPEAELSYPQVVSYSGNFIVFISPRYERVMGEAPNAQLKPALTSQMTQDTVIMWDTAVFPGGENSVGFLTGGDFDGRKFWDGAASPEFRYLLPNDPLSQFPPSGPSNRGQGGLIRLGKVPGGPIDFKNIDPPVNPFQAPVFGYQGIMRFRHNKETQCNVGYADGHVDAFTGKMDSHQVIKDTNHDAVRRKFMIKPPKPIITTF